MSEMAEQKKDRRVPLLADVEQPFPLEIERRFTLLDPLDLSHPALVEAERVEFETTFLRNEEGDGDWHEERDEEWDESVESRTAFARGEWKERVRQAYAADGTTRYYHTRKRRLEKMVQLEHEQEISEEQYRALLAKADPTRVTVRKTRLRLFYGDYIWELDLYDEPLAAPRLEVELEDPTHSPEPPPFLGRLAEVTEDRRFSDRRMAKLAKQGIARPLRPEAGVEL
jgi:CYTH domain-containing protein